MSTGSYADFIRHWGQIDDRIKANPEEMAPFEPLRVQLEVERLGLVTATNQQAALKAASSAVKGAMVEVEGAQRKLEVETEGFKKGISTAQEVAEAELNLKRMKAILEQKRSARNVEDARVQTVRANVTDTRLRAPFAGTIAQRYGVSVDDIMRWNKIKDNRTIPTGKVLLLSAP
jgi:multidrug resistance efflux pump